MMSLTILYLAPEIIAINDQAMCCNFDDLHSCVGGPIHAVTVSTCEPGLYWFGSWYFNFQSRGSFPSGIDNSVLCHEYEPHAKEALFVLCKRRVSDTSRLMGAYIVLLICIQCYTLSGQSS